MAVDYLASACRKFRTKTAVSLEAAAAHVIVPAQARRILVTRFIVVPQVIGGTPDAESRCSLSLGTDASAYQNIIGDDGNLFRPSHLTPVNFAEEYDLQLIGDHQQYVQYADLTASGLRVNIQFAGTNGFTYTAHFVVEGAIF